MEYQNATPTETSQVIDIDATELELLFKSILLPAGKQLTPQERVNVRRKVEDILYEKSYSKVYGDPYSLETV